VPGPEGARQADTDLIERGATVESRNSFGLVGGMGPREDAATLGRGASCVLCLPSPMTGGLADRSPTDVCTQPWGG